VKSGVISNNHLPPGERKVLTAIAQYTDRGGADREQISILSGYKKTSRDTYISRLSQKGMIIVGPQIITTDDGIAALGDFDRLPTGLELQDYWLDRLPEGEAKILRVLLNFGYAIDRDTIGEESGYKQTSRDTYISRLRVRKLIEVTSEGIKAADTLFQ
jgi:hypothetical protein